MQRYDIINWLIEKYGYKSYLEIGVAEGECFEKVECDAKIGCDVETSYEKYEVPLLSSDDFFESLPDGLSPRALKPPYDIIFIDGEHLEDQAMRDINNSLKHLSDNGTIVVHDCNPPMANCAGREPRVFVRYGDIPEYSIWNGTTWKAWVRTRLFNKDLTCRCVDADWGCGIIQRGPWLPFEGQIYSEDATRQHLSYPLMALDRANYLNLITVKQFREIYSGG